MPMKTSDVKTAVALIINGFLRANEGEDRPESQDLEDCLGAIEQEVRDWGENLEREGLDALGPNEIEVSLGNAPRNPYNIESAIKSLVSELRDLDGDESAWKLVKALCDELEVVEA